MRDWTATLFAASYKGQSFFVERTSTTGGRRLVVHQFPMRDDPFIEDMGSDKRGFEMTAYFASDTCDADATAMMAACDSAGPGVLVLPDQGPVSAWCKSFTRAFERDRAGYVAWQMSLVRDGAASALVTIEALGQTIFDAAATTLAALGARANVALVVTGAAGFVVDAAQAAASNLISAVSVAMSLVAPDPATTSLVTGADVNAAIARAAAAIPLGISRRAFDPTLIPAILSAADDFGSMADVAGLWSVAGQMMDASPAPVLAVGTVNQGLAGGNATAGAALLRGLALVWMGQALASLSFDTRPAAIDAKASFSERISFELGRCSGAADADYAAALMTLRGAVVNFMSLSITNLAPVIDVQAARPLPAVWWAWRLYADANRANELVARNNVAMPCAMPTDFEALAS